MLAGVMPSRRSVLTFELAKMIYRRQPQDFKTKFTPFVVEILDSDLTVLPGIEEIRAEMVEIRDEVRKASPTTEPSDDEIHNPDAERRAELRAEREKADVARLQQALDDVLPDVFAKFAVIPETPVSMSPTAIETNREAWIDAWTEVVLQ